MLQEELREIRTQLRLAMNGVTSTSMREMGIVYKLNFGVALPEIKQIAAKHTPNAELAAALWKEDIREFKILATMLQPVEEFTLNQAKEWIADIPYLEIAEQCSRNLFCKIKDVELLLLGAIFNVEKKYARTVAFLVYAELFKTKQTVSSPVVAAFLVECMRTLAWKRFGALSYEKRAAITAMKMYGRQSADKAKQILSGFDVPEYMETAEGQEVYNDLKFEFEYYN